MHPLQLYPNLFGNVYFYGDIAVAFLVVLKECATWKKKEVKTHRLRRY